MLCAHEDVRSSALIHRTHSRSPQARGAIHLHYIQILFAHIVDLFSNYAPLFQRPNALVVVQPSHFGCHLWLGIGGIIAVIVSGHSVANAAIFRFLVYLVTRSQV